MIAAISAYLGDMGVIQSVAIYVAGLALVFMGMCAFCSHIFNKQQEEEDKNYRQLPKHWDGRDN